MKWFIKYDEYVKGRNQAPSRRTIFLNGDDVEEEWSRYKSIAIYPVVLVDILPLPTKTE